MTRIRQMTRTETIAVDRLETAIAVVASRQLGDYAATKQDLREFARAIAIVAVDAITGSRADPVDAVEGMTEGRA